MHSYLLVAIVQQNVKDTKTHGQARNFPSPLCTYPKSFKVTKLKLTHSMMPTE